MYKGDLIKRENGWSIIYSTPHSGKISEIMVSQESAELIHFKYGSKIKFIPDVKFSFSIKDGDAEVKFFPDSGPSKMVKEVEKPSFVGHKIDKPFSKEEEEAMNLLIDAHGKFSQLEQTHPSDITEWLFHLHAMQRILGQRVLRRDYPNIFPTYKTHK